MIPIRKRLLTLTINNFDKYDAHLVQVNEEVDRSSFKNSQSEKYPNLFGEECNNSL